jgi:SAM-dependent methyltransferase
VLYIGTVDADPNNARKHPPIHRALADRADRVTGIYRSESQAAELRAEGLDALSADPECLDLGRSFEVGVVADTIEHVTDAGRFLAALERHLGPDGVLLITTPNPTSLLRILELIGRGKARANPAHTCWYTGQVLDQLARRVGLEVIEEALIDEMHKYRRAEGGLVRRLVKQTGNGLLVGANRVICWMFPQLSETFGFVLIRRRADGREGPG